MTRVAFSPPLVEALTSINGELAKLPDARTGIFPPAGPIVILFSSSRIIQALARKVGVPVVGSNVLFTINSEEDLPRVFADVRNFAREVNSTKEQLTPEMSAAMATWAASTPTRPLLMAGDLAGDEDVSPNPGVFGRHIQLTLRVLVALRLLHDVFASWPSARFMIRPRDGPLTVVMRMASPGRVEARAIGIHSWGPCEVLFVAGIDSALDALGKLRLLSAKVREMVAAIPRNLPGGAGSAK